MSLELFGGPDGDVLPIRDLVLELPVHEVAKFLDLAAIGRDDADVTRQNLESKKFHFVTFCWLYSGNSDRGKDHKVV